MSVEYSCHIEGLDKLQKRFADSPGIVADETRKAMRVAVDHTLEQVAGRTPINTGQLRGSIATEVRGAAADIQGIVGTPLIYGWPVEAGREPGKMPPVDAIEYWVIRKGIASPPESRGVAFLIARAIGVGTSRGIMRPGGGARMFEKGLEEATPVIEKEFEQVAERILDRLAK